jgi:D-3-phosphoglycerate dehydrogenase
MFLGKYKVKTLNHISPACQEVLVPERYEMADDMQSPDAIFVRATNMLDYEFNPELKCIARAGIGVNTIPLERCSESGIVVFNSPGANANGVKELFLFGMSMASRDILGGMNWVYNYHDDKVPVDVAMEQVKKQFVGPEYYTKCLGVIGMGNVGRLVANIGIDLGMKVCGYDPYLSVDAAWKISRHVERLPDLDSLLRRCDYITIHTPLTDETRDMINAAAIEKMKDGVRIINYARGEVVNEDDILAALERGKVARFVTDFPTPRNVKVKNVVATPHLGGTTIESEANCAVMAAQEMDDYLRNGNIRNSVNMPTLVLERSGKVRICVIHRNLPGMLTTIMPIFARDGVNIENMTNKSAGAYAYSVFDVNSDISQEVGEKIRKVEGVLRVRVLD